MKKTYLAQELAGAWPPPIIYAEGEKRRSKARSLNFTENLKFKDEQEFKRDRSEDGETPSKKPRKKAQEVQAIDEFTFFCADAEAEGDKDDGNIQKRWTAADEQRWKTLDREFIDFIHKFIDWKKRKGLTFQQVEELMKNNMERNKGSVSAVKIKWVVQLPELGICLRAYFRSIGEETFSNLPFDEFPIHVKTRGLKYYEIAPFIRAVYGYDPDIDQIWEPLFVFWKRQGEVKLIITELEKLIKHTGENNTLTVNKAEDFKGQVFTQTTTPTLTAKKDREKDKDSSGSNKKEKDPVAKEREISKKDKDLPIKKEKPKETAESTKAKQVLPAKKNHFFKEIKSRLSVLKNYTNFNNAKLLHFLNQRKRQLPNAETIPEPTVKEFTQWLRADEEKFLSAESYRASVPYMRAVFDVPVAPEVGDEYDICEFSFEAAHKRITTEIQTRMLQHKRKYSLTFAKLSQELLYVANEEDWGKNITISPDTFATAKLRTWLLRSSFYAPSTPAREKSRHILSKSVSRWIQSREKGDKLANSIVAFMSALELGKDVIVARLNIHQGKDQAKALVLFDQFLNRTQFGVVDREVADAVDSFLKSVRQNIISPK